MYHLLSCRVFQQIATLGLYLFNDALVITKRTSKHFPFSRAIEYTYKFETSLALTSMQVVDMPDSKCECFLFLLVIVGSVDFCFLMELGNGGLADCFVLFTGAFVNLN